MLLLATAARRVAAGAPRPLAAGAPRARGLRQSARLLEAFVVKVPPMGEAVKHGDLVEWLKKEGDTVKMDEVICVLETDKVTVDIRTPVAGVLVKQMAKKDETVNTDQPIAAIEQSATAVASTPAAAPAPPKAAATAPAAAPDAHSLSARRPSIHFRYGKREEAAAPAAPAAPANAAAAASVPAAAAVSPSAGAQARPVKTVSVDLPPSYGRLPPLTEKEALRLQLGGADP
jgi:pyruvate/2-oxoglutarate dehydrogenase complex dihydrolipoamide acyltransferase (E2) component